jgi:hypothetical protein
MRSQGGVARLFIIAFGVAAVCTAGRAQTVSTPVTSSTVTNQSQGSSSSSGGAISTTESGSQASPDKAQTVESAKKGKRHVRLGSVMLAAAYVHEPNGFFFSPFIPYSLAYAPFFYDPFYGPWSFYAPYGPSLAYAADKGQIELAVDQKNAEVYIDDAYAGLAGHLKNMWLAPGAYNLTVAAADGSSFHQRVYVLSGKSVKIKARLLREIPQEKAQEKQP